MGTISLILSSKWVILGSLFISIMVFAVLLIQILKKPWGEYEERYLETASGKLDQMYVFIPPQTMLYIKFVACFILFLFTFFICTGIPFVAVQIVISVSAGLFGFFAPEIFMMMMLKKRLETFELQLVEALSAMANSLKAGFSFPQSLDLVVKEGMPPLSQEFNLVIKESKLGVSLEKALINVTKRVDSEDLDLVVSSIVLTRELGGNLAAIFEKLASTIRERMKLKGKIKSLTSQGIMQGVVVGAMPLGMGVILFFVNPEMMDLFFNHIAGWICVGVVIVLEIVGAFFIKKIVTIDI